MQYNMEVIHDGGRVCLACHGKETLLSVLLRAGVEGVEAPCGGRGRCGKCLVAVTGDLRSSETGEACSVHQEQVPACRFMPAGDCVLTLRGPGEMRIAADGAGRITPAGQGLGFAADIGTTTVAAYLYDLSDGRMLGARGERNAQFGCGGDVISRITACGEGKLPLLRDMIQEQLAEMAQKLCREAGADTACITRAVIAGNTVMLHIFDGLDPTGIGFVPFTPASLFGDVRRSQNCLPGLKSEAEVYLCPCVSGYVGGDVTAGLSYCGGDMAEGLMLYVDIGTNGEMALGNQDGFLTCAAAAGPAFEGAEIACGMGAVPGAIDRVWAENGAIGVHVIGDGTAVGLCGSGLIDAVAALVCLGVIDETGRMNQPDELPPGLAAGVFSLPDGTRAFRLRDSVYLAARDVRQAQLAKAAIRAGADTLLARMGKGAEDVTELVIAGGFGSYIDIPNALRIGLLPPVPPGRIRHGGNAAGAGAAMALHPKGAASLEALAAKCAYIELSSSTDFMDRFINSMTLGEETA